MSIFDRGHPWAAIKAELQKLSALVPEGKTLELLVFGGAVVAYWGMEGRLSRDVDVQQSRSSEFLADLAPAGGMIRDRDSQDPEPDRPFVEIAAPEADQYLPRFSANERVEIAGNVMLLLPTPAEIATSKLTRLRV